jgi:hypothetical protein
VDLPVLAVFPVQPVDFWSAVVFGDLLSLVLAARDVPFDHLVYLGPYDIYLTRGARPSLAGETLPCPQISATR